MGPKIISTHHASAARPRRFSGERSRRLPADPSSGVRHGVGAAARADLGAERCQHHSAGSEQTCPTTTKKPTTRPITMATTVKASKEVSDIRRLGGVAKSRVVPDGALGVRLAAGSEDVPSPNGAGPRSHSHLPRPPQVP